VAQRIAKVFDQYLSFIALEGRLFSLGLRETYLQLNDPNAQDFQIQVGLPALVFSQTRRFLILDILRSFT
jgi:hypothetical protein